MSGRDGDRRLRQQDGGLLGENGRLHAQKRKAEYFRRKRIKVAEDLAQRCPVVVVVSFFLAKQLLVVHCRVDGRTGRGSAAAFDIPYRKCEL